MELSRQARRAVSCATCLVPCPCSGLFCKLSVHLDGTSGSIMQCILCSRYVHNSRALDVCFGMSATILHMTFPVCYTASLPYTPKCHLCYAGARIFLYWRVNSCRPSLPYLLSRHAIMRGYLKSMTNRSLTGNIFQFNVNLYATKFAEENVFWGPNCAQQHSQVIQAVGRPCKGGAPKMGAAVAMNSAAMETWVPSLVVPTSAGTHACR